MHLAITAAPIASSASAGPWLLASVLIAMVASNAAWLLFLRADAGSRLQGFLAWPASSAILWLAEAFFVLLLPMWAWRTGAISPYFLGVSELDWVTQLSDGGFLALIVLIGFVLGWRAYRRTVQSPALPPNARYLALVNALLLQWHWAFYRAAAIGWLADPVRTAMPGFLQPLAAQPLYWGTWLGLAAVICEGALNPFVRLQSRTAGEVEKVIRQLVLAVATGALFALTRNFWMCLACHVLADTLTAPGSSSYVLSTKKSGGS